MFSIVFENQPGLECFEFVGLGMFKIQIFHEKFTSSSLSVRLWQFFLIKSETTSIDVYTVFATDAR